MGALPFESLELTRVENAPRLAIAKQDQHRLLLVDADADFAVLLDQRLTAADDARFEVVRASNLAAACNLLESESFDIILLDLTLSGARGLEAFAAVYASAASVPIVILTKSNDDLLAFRAVHSGAQDYLVKGQAYGTLLVRTLRYAIEHRRSQEAMRLQARLLDEINEAVVAVDRFSRVTMWNRYAEAMFGWSRREAEGRRLSELVGVADTSGAPLSLDTLVEESAATSWSRELKLRSRFGATTDGLIQFNSLTDSVGARTGAVIVMIDITESRRAEEQIRFQAHLLDTVEQAVIAVDLEGRILYWNKYASALYGWEAQETLGHSILDIMPLEAIADRTGTLDRLRQGRGWSGELWLKRKDGTNFPASVTDTPILDDRGQVVGMVGVSADLTEQHRLDEQLRQSQKLEAIGTLAGGVAHDFNNILTSITGYAELLINALDESDCRRQDAVEVRNAADRAAALTRQLLAFSRKQILQPRVLDLSRVMSEMEKMLSRLIREDIQLITHLERDGPKIKADVSQVEQVIVNLVVNARDAMPHGGTLTIETRTVSMRDGAVDSLHFGLADGAYALLQITDTGSGMDPDTLGRIFEPFFTTKPVGQGTGLGLSTVYGIVKQSSGSVVVESTPGQGTRFSIALPITDETVQLDTRQRVSQPHSHGVGRILVVEDDRTLRNLVSRVLRKAGYTVIEAQTGGDAIRILEDNREVDLIVSDVIMPGMSGPAMVDHLRHAGNTVPVVFMSGYTTEDMRFEHLLSPETVLIEKPFSPSGLLETVQKILE